MKRRDGEGGEGGRDRPVVPSTVWRWCFVCEMGGDSELFLAPLRCTGSMHKLDGTHRYSMMSKLTTAVAISVGEQVKVEMNNRSFLLVHQESTPPA